MKSKKNKLNGKVFYVHGQEDALFSRWQLLPTKSRDSTQSQSEPQEVILWTSTDTFREAEDPKSPPQC